LFSSNSSGPNDHLESQLVWKGLNRGESASDTTNLKRGDRTLVSPSV